MNNIIIGIGANLIPDGFSSLQNGLVAAINMMDEYGIEKIKCSSWYETSPVPVSDQPLFRNAVFSAFTDASPQQLLLYLNEIESRIGRVRTITNAARVIDLDILDFNSQRVISQNLVIPHPRMHLRAFVLVPLQEIRPDYVHPVTKESISSLIAVLPKEQKILRLKD